MQINKIRNKKGKIAKDTTEIQRIIRDYLKQLYAKNGQPRRLNKYLEKYGFLRLNQDEIENISRQPQVLKLKL